MNKAKIEFDIPFCTEEKTATDYLLDIVNKIGKTFYTPNITVKYEWNGEMVDMEFKEEK